MFRAFSQIDYSILNGFALAGCKSRTTAGQTQRMMVGSVCGQNVSTPEARLDLLLE
jgi:hypothetical protein